MSPATDFKLILKKIDDKIKATEKDLLKKNYFTSAASKSLSWEEVDEGKWRIVHDGKPLLEHEWQTKAKVSAELPELIQACDTAMTNLFSDSLAMLENPIFNSQTQSKS